MCKFAPIYKGNPTEISIGFLFEIIGFALSKGSQTQIPHREENTKTFKAKSLANQSDFLRSRHLPESQRVNLLDSQRSCSQKSHQSNS